MEVGDYVTHMDHGIGRFGGLQHIDVQGKKQEAIKLIYVKEIFCTSASTLCTKFPNSMERMGGHPSSSNWDPKHGKR